MRWPWQVAGGESQEQSEVCSDCRHIHNYERCRAERRVYLVSGEGGATPYPVEPHPGGRLSGFFIPNYHYFKICGCGEILKGQWYRLANPGHFTWEVKDTFEIPDQNK